MFALQFQMEAALTIYGVLTVPIHVPFATMEESAMTSVGAVSVRRDSKETIVNLVNKIDKCYNHLEFSIHPISKRTAAGKYTRERMKRNNMKRQKDCLNTNE